MGCPVGKVVKSGCGSALLKDPARVLETVRLAASATGKPLSVKIRLGWDKQTYTFQEVADAAVAGGAAWLTVHGRLRSDDYATPVDMGRIAVLKRRLAVPVIGNGNVFARGDQALMRQRTGCDGVMVSRGALGNPWVFREILTGDPTVGLGEWRQAVLDHLRWQAEEYGDGSSMGAVCMRKHLLWYVKGWPGAKRARALLATAASLDAARELIEAFADELAQQGILHRLPIATEDAAQRYVFDPKFDMDRGLDRGVGDDHIGAEAL
jgi:tRNA-dihydrouridine synthase